MTAIGKVVRTTAFKLSVFYLVVFTVLSLFLIGYISLNTRQVLFQHQRDRIDNEIRSLSQQYRKRGIRGLVRVVDRRSRTPGASLYLVTDFTGKVLAGNVSSLDRDVLEDADGRPQPVGYRRLDAVEADTFEPAIVRVFSLRGGSRILVGRDVGERERLKKIIGQAVVVAGATIILLGLISWFFVSRRVLKRIDSMSATSQQIMAGDLAGRLQVTGTGDEFDRLAESLNAMLERIERLMSGIKHVSDNIAHDLKTPLTRLRNRLETTQHQPETMPNYRQIMESTVEEADQLIRTFDALLMISRIEAGSTGASFKEIDISEIATGMCELYEPVAEEAGISFTCEISGTVKMDGNRELIGQAIANMLDNAIKYCVKGTGSHDSSEIGSGDGSGDKNRIASGPDGPKIAVIVRNDETTITCTIQDNGPGIARADSERVLQRFVRLDDSRSEPGSGLGLSLVDAVVRLHNGSLDLEDNKPGLRAVMSFPIKHATGHEIGES